MAPLSNHEVIRRYVDAHARHDYAELERLRAADWLEEWPQTGERVRGHANDAAIMAAWPGGEPHPDDIRVVGSEDRWVATPSWTFERVTGAGDHWWGDAIAHYPDGSTWFAIGLFEVHDGQVHRETCTSHSLSTPRPGAPSGLNAWSPRSGSTGAEGAKGAEGAVRTEGAKGAEGAEGAAPPTPPRLPRDAPPSGDAAPGGDRPSVRPDVDYKGAPLDAEKGPGLGCFWLQVVALVVVMLLTPLSAAWNWPIPVTIVLLASTLVLLLFVGQTVIFLLRLVAADRRTDARRRPLQSRTKTVGEIEDESKEAGGTDR